MIGMLRLCPDTTDSRPSLERGDVKTLVEKVLECSNSCRA